ncbi:MAG: hypothetical protein PHC61_07715, partial [Chitinivibrionales bacterium]|nr:hypothetical protein [Chitinivibrionales bacterium]
MVSIKSFSIAAIILSTVVFSADSAEQKPTVKTAGAKSEAWTPIDAADWSVWLDAPKYHFALAKEYLKSGDYTKASAELKLGNSFLLFQNYRIAAAAKQIKVLSDNVAAGRFKDLKKLDAATDKVIKIIDNKYAMLPLVDTAAPSVTSVPIDNIYAMPPVEIRADSLFEKEYTYHSDKAKTKLQENDRTGAASEIRKAGSFLRLKAAHMEHIAKADLDTAGNELKELAAKVEAGTIKDVK